MRTAVCAFCSGERRFHVSIPMGRKKNTRHSSKNCQIASVQHGISTQKASYGMFFPTHTFCCQYERGPSAATAYACAGSRELRPSPGRGWGQGHGDGMEPAFVLQDLACHASDARVLYVKILLYADDIVILCEHPADLQRALDAAAAWARLRPGHEL